jgi:hypothetical protein
MELADACDLKLMFAERDQGPRYSPGLQVELSFHGRRLILSVRDYRACRTEQEEIDVDKNPNLRVDLTAPLQTGRLDSVNGQVSK